MKIIENLNAIKKTEVPSEEKKVRSKFNKKGTEIVAYRETVRRSPWVHWIKGKMHTKIWTLQTGRPTNRLAEPKANRPTRKLKFTFGTWSQKLRSKSFASNARVSCGWLLVLWVLFLFYKNNLHSIPTGNIYKDIDFSWCRHAKETAASWR